MLEAFSKSGMSQERTTESWVTSETIISFGGRGATWEKGREGVSQKRGEEEIRKGK